MRPFLIYDLVLESIRDQIASHRPERGGALLGLRGLPVATHFIWDEQAATTPASYVPSAELTYQVNRIESGGSEELKMIIHSHPGRFDRLSGPDLAALGTLLRENPHLPWVGAPVVTLDHPVTESVDHVLPLGDGHRITFYAAWRGGKTGDRLPRIEHLPVRVVPVASTMEDLARQLPGASGRAGLSGRRWIDFQGVHFFGATLCHALGESTFLFPAEYPILPPLVLHADSDGGPVEPLAMKWHPGAADPSQLSRCLLSALYETRKTEAPLAEPGKEPGRRRPFLPSLPKKRAVRFLFPENPGVRSFKPMMRACTPRF